MDGVWALYRNVYLWACERLYHELAPAYDWAAAAVSLGAWEAWRRSALAHLPPADNAQPLRVLELGPGTGALLAQMVAEGFAVVGLERSAPMVATALASQPWRGRAPLCQGDARALPFGAASFDAALATFPAPFILEAATLAEAARVLRPGGRLIVVGLWTSAPQWRPGISASGAEESLRAGEADRLPPQARAQIEAAGFALMETHDLVLAPGRFGAVIATVGGFVATRKEDAHDG